MGDKDASTLVPQVVIPCASFLEECKYDLHLWWNISILFGDKSSWALKTSMPLSASSVKAPISRKVPRQPWITLRGKTVRCRPKCAEQKEPRSFVPLFFDLKSAFSWNLSVQKEVQLPANVNVIATSKVQLSKGTSRTAVANELKRGRGANLQPPNREDLGAHPSSCA